MTDAVCGWPKCTCSRQERCASAKLAVAEATEQLEERLRPRTSEPADKHIDAVLRLPVADGEDVAFYLLHGCEGVSPEVESIMVREVVRTILTGAQEGSTPPFVEVPDYINALACIDLVDRLLEEGGYTEDSSARHNLAIGRSLISAASARAAPTWIPVSERLPEIGTDCLVWKTSRFAKGPYMASDRWDEQRECPVSFSTVTVPIGPGWYDSDFDEVTHWMPFPAAPAT